MARIRSIKPEFYSDTTLADVSLTARYFYIGLFCQLDRQGVTVEDAKFLKREVFPYDDDITINKVQNAIDALVGIRRLIRFQYQGKNYLFCPKFMEHQKFHSEEKNRFEIPAEVLEAACSHLTEGNLGERRPPSNTLSTVTNASASSAVSCIPVSGILVSGIPENCISETLPDPPGPVTRFDFEEIYREYPLKEGKADGLKHCKSQIKTKVQYSQLLSAVRGYRAKCEREGTEKKFIKHFSTFMAGGKWRDYLEPDVGTSDLKLNANGLDANYWDFLKTQEPQ